MPQRGSFDELPLAQIVADFAAYYPPELSRSHASEASDFGDDGARERADERARAGAQEGTPT